MKLRDAAAVGSIIVALLGLSVIDVEAVEKPQELAVVHVDLSIASIELRPTASTRLVLEAPRSAVVVIEASSHFPGPAPELAALADSVAEVLDRSPGRWVVALRQAGAYEVTVEAEQAFDLRIESYQGRRLSALTLGELDASQAAPPAPEAGETSSPSAPPPVEEPESPILVATEWSDGGGGAGNEDYNEDPVTVRSAPQPDGRPSTLELRQALVELPASGAWLFLEQDGAVRLPATAQARVYALCDGGRAQRLHLCAPPLAQGTRTSGHLDPASAPRRLHAFQLQQAAWVSLQGVGDLDLRGRLYDTDGALLAVDDDSGDALGFRFDRQLPAGRYVLEVDAVDAASGAYELVLDTRVAQP